MKSTFSDLTTKFFYSFLAAERGVSKNTMASYSDSLRLLIRYLCDRFKIEPEQIKIERITDEIIIDFLNHIEKEKGNSISTRNQRLAAIKTFFHFIARKKPEMMHMNECVQAIRPKQQQHTPPSSLTRDEIKAILNAADSSTVIGMRDKLIILLLYNTGARVQEICDLKLSDIILEKAPSIKVTGKGRKTRIIPIWRKTADIIIRYIDLRKEKEIDSEYLLVNIRGEAMTRFGIGRRIEHYAKKASEQCISLKNRNITPHVFRHTAALHILESGSDITIIKDLLGHVDLKTTSQYLEVSISRKQKALEKFPAPGLDTEPKDKELIWKKPDILKYLTKISNMRYVAS